jgi:DNA polymerase eta
MSDFLTSSEHTGYDSSRSKQSPFPFTRNVTVDVILGFAERLWKDLVGNGSKQDGSLPFSVTSIALGFSGVEPGEAGQQSIEGFFRPGASTKPQSSDGHNSEALRIHHEKRRLEAEDSESSSLDQKNMASFVCPRCHKHIEVDIRDDGEEESEQRRAQALARLRLEHGDFHMAEDLSKAPDDGDVGGSQGLRVVERETKRKRESNVRKDKPIEGIAKFLVRRPG